MTPPLPKPPWVLFGLLAVLTVGALCFGAAFAQDDWSGRMFHDLGQTVAGLAAALLVGSGLIRIWQAREWTKRTRTIALDLVGQAMRETAIIASQALHVLGADNSIATIDLAFRLPWTPARNGHAQRLEAMAESSLRAPLSVETAPDGTLAAFRAMDQRAADLTAGMEQRIARLWAVGLELGPYVHGDPIELVRHAAELRKHARRLIGPLPGARVPGQAPAGNAAIEVVAASIKLALLLGKEDEAIRAQATTTDAVLIAAEAAQDAERESFQEAFEAARRDFENLTHDIERTTRDFQSGVDELNATWKKRLADPSPDALHTIKDQLAQIQDRLADAKSALQDEGLEEEPHRRDPDAG